MKCPFCNEKKDKVVDSREINDGKIIRRRRECLSCTKRYTTYERIEEIPFSVVKKDGSREDFDRKKVFDGIARACEKRPVNKDKIEELVDNIVTSLFNRDEREIKSVEIGEKVMDGLKKLDSVAYVRFASVYRQFKDVEEFMEELKGFVKGGKSK
jgi:transcriptional repressor NrdR